MKTFGVYLINIKKNILQLVKQREYFLKLRVERMLKPTKDNIIEAAL